MDKFQPPKGTRDIIYEDASIRRKVIDRLKDVFLRFGFSDFDTPALEHMETLSRKAGAEVEEQIYGFEDKAGRQLGLIFEFTASLGRVAASSREIIRPFKRYQIGKVWRYENPQSNRYREFCQADVDIIGPYTMDCEAEILLLASTVMKEFGLSDFTIFVNNRKILRGQLEAAEISDPALQEIVLRALDKLDKIGSQAVREYAVGKGVPAEKYDRFADMLPKEVAGNEDVLRRIETAIAENPIGAEGVSELRQILGMSAFCGLADRVIVAPSLVRGLGYYTGPIFEIRSRALGDISFGGGGRYDGMVESYGGAPAGAVGFAFGVERLVAVLAKEGLVRGAKSEALVMTAVSGPAMVPHAMALAKELRDAGIPTYQYVGEAKLAKQFSFASRMGFPFVAIAGEREIAAGNVRIKKMASGEERDVPRSDAAAAIRSWMAAGDGTAPSRPRA